MYVVMVRHIAKKDCGDSPALLVYLKADVKEEFRASIVRVVRSVVGPVTCSGRLSTIRLLSGGLNTEG